MGEIKGIPTSKPQYTGNQANELQGAEETKVSPSKENPQSTQTSSESPGGAPLVSQREVQLRKAEHHLEETVRKAELTAATPRSAKGEVQTRKDLLRTMDHLTSDLSTLENSYNHFRMAAEGLAELHSKFSTKTEEVAKLADTANKLGRKGKALDALFEAINQMQEMQMSFNLQYLYLQSQMQHENRSFTMIANIMKTKHETVKNSLPNVR